MYLNWSWNRVSESAAVLDTANRNDFENWLKLAAEVEHLFGPMCEAPEFRHALLESLEQERALCVRGCDTESCASLCGGIIISPEENRIEWFAVAKSCRGMGIGRLLLNAALAKLDSGREICVQTFAADSQDGVPARALYLSAGFIDGSPAEPTPAGVPTVMMIRPAVLAG
jgi:GNAT superfamily N-acetyltransferase